MKPSDIQVGRCYTNDKGRIRKVLDIGPQSKFYPGTNDLLCVCYMLVDTGMEDTRNAGQLGCIALDSFAFWADHETATIPVVPFEPVIAYLYPVDRDIPTREAKGDNDIFIERGFPTIQDAFDRSGEMKKAGYRHVTVFALPCCVPRPKVLTWTYIQSRIIHTTQMPYHEFYEEDAACL